jgi:hypothetical protein
LPWLVIPRNKRSGNFFILFDMPIITLQTPYFIYSWTIGKISGVERVLIEAFICQYKPQIIYISFFLTGFRSVSVSLSLSLSVAVILALSLFSGCLSLSFSFSGSSSLSLYLSLSVHLTLSLSIPKAIKNKSYVHFKNVLLLRDFY